jgi:hypothetical protein
MAGVGNRGKARALPWARKGADGPFDPTNGVGDQEGGDTVVAPDTVAPLLITHPIPGFQGPSALGGVRGGAPAFP